MKSKTIFIPKTEWDLGLDSEAYTTFEYAVDAIREAHEAQDMEDSFKDCWDDGLYMVEEWVLYG